MNRGAPLVTIIIPAHNGALWIAETLESVLGQTHERREIIVVDDGSTDDTLQRLAPYRRRIHLIEQDNLGPGSARNAGLRVATGDYIALIDHDDLWLPEKLETQVQVAAGHPESGLIVCNGVEFDEHGLRHEQLLPADLLAGLRDGEVTGDYFPNFVERCLICCPAQTLIPRPVVERVGAMNTIRGEPADWDYYLRIAALSPVTFHRHSLVRWRHLASSRSGRADRRYLIWELMGMRMLRRHQRLRTLRDVDLVAASLDQRLRRNVRAAYYHGRRGDVAFARCYLRAMLRLFPARSVVWVYFVALWLPERVVRDARRLMGPAVGGRQR